MDARHVVTELRARLGGLPTSDTRRMVEAFFAFAAEPSSYEDGQVSTDTVFLSASVIDESMLTHWYPESTKPEPSSVLLELRREILIVDTFGDQLTSAEAHCEILFPPAAQADNEADIDFQGPAGDHEDAYDFPTLEAARTEFLRSLAKLLDRPAMSVTLDGYAPTTPTEASLASPTLDPVQLVGHGGELDLGFAPDDFDRQFRGRKLGEPGSWDTARAVELLVEFCARPLAHGAFTVTRDETVIEFFRLEDFEGDDPAQLRLKREIDLVGPDGKQHDGRIGCTLLFALAADVLALPTEHTIRALAATATTPTGEPYDVERLDDVPEAFRASPIGPLLDRLADDYWPAATI